jgi:RNA polymerase sigma factor (sigma-70 family)
MPAARFGNVIQFLYKVSGIQEARDLTDCELLEKFLAHKDETAFATLVERHGPMVFSVCRRVLGDPHEAEDVFQATFLVLVRRMRSIGGNSSIGGWLHEVARRIALKARTQKAARRHRETEAGNMRSARAVDDLSLEELRTVLDEEIASLPEKHRAPIVLCHLEGKTYDQAARELGCTKISLARRLARARELLRRQLERRGIGLAAGALATSLAGMTVAAPLPGLLTIKTVKAATLVAGGKAVAGTYLSARALALAEEAIRGMLLIKGKLVLMVMALGLAVAGAGWAGYKGLAETGQPAPAANAQLPAPKKQAQDPLKNGQHIGMDQYGDPLPDGAIARLGAKRFRHDGFGQALAFGPDGKTLVGSTISDVRVWDAATGKERYRLPCAIPSGIPVVMPGGTVSVSSDGATLAISEVVPPSADQYKVSLWQLDSGKKIRTLSSPKVDGQEAQLVHLSFTPDGKSLACNSPEGKALIFDFGSGLVRDFLGGQDLQDCYNLVVSPDGKTLAAAVRPKNRNPKNPNAVNGKHAVQLWEIESGKLVRTIRELPIGSNVETLAFAPNGKLLAFAIGNSIFVCDPATAKELARFDAYMGQNIGLAIRKLHIGLAFAPDGKTLVSASTLLSANEILDGKVRVWDVVSGEIMRTLDARASQVVSIALSPDGKTVALGSDSQSLQLYDVTTGNKLFAEFQGHDSRIERVAYAPDGKTLVSVGSYASGVIWDTATQQQKGILRGSARCLSFSSDGKWLASVGGEKDDDAEFTWNYNKVQIWDTAASRKVSVITVPDALHIVSVSFSPDGRRLFTLDWNRNRPNQYGIHHWDVATGKQEKSWFIGGKTGIPVYLPVYLAPDGKTAFSVLENGDISVHDVESGHKRLFRGEVKEWRSLKLSPDARVLASGTAGPNGTVGLWEVLTGKEMCTLQGLQGRAEALAWSPDGRLVASGEFRTNLRDQNIAQTVRVWDTATGKEVAKFGAFETDVWSLTFSPDGKHLVAGLRDSTILIWDVSKTNPRVVRTSKLGKNEFESRWSDLGGGNVGKAHEAIWALLAAPMEAVSLLRGRLKPAPVAEHDRIQQWLADLNSDKFAVRQAAVKELEKVGEQVQPPIHKALKANPSLETRRRLEQILNTLSDVPARETLRTIRAIMALERIGSPEAQGVLQTLARGAEGARETEEARASLERLARRN